MKKAYGKLSVLIAVLMVIALGVGVYFTIRYVNAQQNLQHEDATLASVAKIAFPEGNYTPDTENPLKTASDASEQTPEEDTYDFSALKAINEDCIGWLRIDGTKIDYPLMWKPDDNAFYLKHDFYGNYTAHGTPYLDAAYGPDGHLVIYGHNMSDGRYFHSLGDYIEKDYWEEHREITAYVYNTRYTYEVFSVFTLSASTEDAFYRIPDTDIQDEFQRYLKQVNERAIYQTDVAVGSTDRILLLSTCEYSRSDGRLVVLAHECDAVELGK